MVEINNLQYTYPNAKEPALKSVNLSFENSGLFYIVGESGSGKSTLIHLMSGMLKGYDGEILIDGKELSQFTYMEECEYLRQTCAVSFQIDEVSKENTVWDNLMTSLEISKISEVEKVNRVRTIAEKLNLTKLLKTKAKLLSGGEIKRVSLARALIKDYSILLLDEPLGPMDKTGRNKLNKIFVEASKNSLVVIVSHNKKEIPSSASILKVTDGAVSVVRKSAVNKAAARKSQRYIRSKPNVFSTFIDSCKLLINRGKHAYFSIFTTSLALVTIGLTILISSSISVSLKSYLSGIIEANSILVQPRKEEITDTTFSSASLQEVENIAEDYGRYNYGVGASYDLNFENIFTDANNVYFTRGNSTYRFTKLSGRSFEEFTYICEMEERFSYLEKYELSDDQVILGLSFEELQLLGNFFSISISDGLAKINEYIAENHLCLHLDLECASIGYKLENIFNVAEIVETDSDEIIHTNPMFAKRFVETNMHFQGKEDLDLECEKPWIVHRSYFIYFSPKLRREALNLIGENSNYKLFLFKPLTDEYNQLQEGKRKNRIGVYNNYRSDIFYSDIANMEKTYSSHLSNILISDGFYYYSNEGMVSGFLHPVFASSKRELLNEIADYNYSAEFNLHGFQGSSIEVGDGVVMGDLSNTQENPLTFHPYIHTPELVKGYVPTNEKGVVISTGLAKSVFHTTDVVSSKLYLSCLTETKYLSGGYKNIFVDGELLVTGTIDSEENAIYQSTRFIRNLGEDQFDLKLDEQNIEKVILKFDRDFNSKDILKDLTTAYDNYEFSLPGESIQNGVDEVIGYVQDGLILFGGLSCVIAGVLMTSVLILFIKKDTNRIKLLTCLGWSNKDISYEYWTVGFIIGFLSFINSSITTFITNAILSNELANDIGVVMKTENTKIIIVNFVFALLFVLISCALANRSLKKDHSIFK